MKGRRINYNQRNIFRRLTLLEQIFKNNLISALQKLNFSFLFYASEICAAMNPNTGAGNQKRP